MTRPLTLYLVLLTLASTVTTNIAGLPGPWTIVTNHADFSARDSAHGAVFLGKMWLSSGYPNDIADLWSSSDGKSWVRVLEMTPYPVYSDLTVYNGKLWSVGGSVWSSDDGVNWVEVLDFDHRPFRWASAAVAYDGRIWALGDGSEVWSSTDGANWIPNTQNAAYGDRSAPAVAVFDGKLWLMGGSTPAPGKGYSNPDGLGYSDIDMNNDVWSSPDGTNWTRVTEHAPWKGRMWFSAQSYAGRLWIMGGYDNDAYANLGDTWYTTDGVNWQQETQSEISWSPRHAPTTFVFNDSLWFAAGNAWPFQNDVWRLTATPTAQTTTTVTVSTNPATHGQSVTFTAAVTPAAATGIVTFKDGTTTLATAQVSSGEATFTTATLGTGTHTVAASYSGDADYAASSASIQEEIIPVSLTPPESFRAAAVSLSQVNLTWSAVPNAARYEIFRKSGPGGYSLVGTSIATNFVDAGVLQNVTYAYFVRAIDASNNAGPSSIPDLATTVLFTDDPIVAGSTVVKAVHLIELRTAVNSVLACAGMSAGSYSDVLITGVTITAAHVRELRSSLDLARSALGLPALSYTDPLLAGGDAIKAVHVQELRSGVK